VHTHAGTFTDTLRTRFSLVAALAAQPAFGVEVTGRGRPMLLIPGFSGQPAMADSAKMATWREAVARYIRDRKLGRPVIVGHSLGGFLALDLEATHPELHEELHGETQRFLSSTGN
jgi:pimeloyl-ACP methyl ester carboxylesterase